MNGGRKINNISAFTYGKYMRTEKITFKGSSELKLGDTLKGVVIKQDSEGNNVTIKLTNGMEIDAELQGEVDLKGGILNFEVIDLKDNTLFLKLASNNKEVIKEQGGNEGIDEIMNFILKEGLKKEDYNMLKAMVKYNIPLTRENITTVKSVLEFSGKMNNNPEEIKSFINTYLNSRDIVVNSREGLQIAQKLYEFFKAFSQADLQEVLLFLENNIEFTKGNLDSFNKLFNSENTMEKVIDAVNEEIGKAIAIEDELLSENTVEQSLKQITLKNGDEYTGKGQGTEVGKTIIATLVKESSKSQSINDNIVRDIIKNHSITDDDAKEIIKLMRNDSNYVMSKETLKENILKHTGREVVLNDVEAKSLEAIINKEVIKDKDINFIKSLFNNIESKQISVAKELESNEIRENIFNISKNLAKNVTEKSEGAKEVIRNIISNLKEGNGNSAQILNIMKSSINDLKLFNKINDQYYCLDVPVNFKENEYPCKPIIKDDRKDGKVIDSTNFKVAVSVKTKKLGTVDAFLNVRNRNIDIQLKCNKNVMNLFVISKNKLKDIVESSGFSTKIEVIERTEELQLLSCREFFNDNNIAVVDITV
ncbi:MAG: hypothetical protein PUJ05_07155 [Clostridium sp.]|uniref:hypothetical protein n=1 Tax=Clostridium sp. TaxID=1506 RepID=UPI0026738DD0|nr:hypothetical protein [Clostridium sp.]MDD7682720.1 hypothetical protein [Clostridium sp.]MDY2578977.1 hypothetical protein [Clostridium sp.]